MSGLRVVLGRGPRQVRRDFNDAGAGWEWVRWRLWFWRSLGGAFVAAADEVLNEPL